MITLMLIFVGGAVLMAIAAHFLSPSHDDFDYTDLDLEHTEDDEADVNDFHGDSN